MVADRCAPGFLMNLTARLKIKAGSLRQSWHERVLWRRQGSPLRSARLLEKPPVIYLIHHRQTWRQQIRALAQRFRGQPGLLLIGHWWVQNAEVAAEMQAVVNYAKRRLADWKIVSLCNSAAEAALYAQSEVETAFINQNAFVDERIFVIKPGCVKKFDAVYDAQLVSFKRHLLAAKIPSVALISYRYAMNFRSGYAEETRVGLPHGQWINDPRAEHHRMLSAEEVTAHLNEAKVGLCLSAEEGAMYASIQYLLCGLPVVSTESIGGRDVLFNDQDCLIVEANPDAVAAGVAKMIARNLRPEEIRARAIANMTIHRNKLIQLVQSFLDEAGVKEDFSAVYAKRFTNKWVKPRRIEEL